MHACAAPAACNTQVPNCECVAGYYGQACELKRCAAPCLNGGSCNADGECVCRTGFTGPTCAQRRCPADCSGRGTCDAATVSAWDQALCVCVCVRVIVCVCVCVCVCVGGWV